MAYTCPAHGSHAWAPAWPKAPSPPAAQTASNPRLPGDAPTHPAPGRSETSSARLPDCPRATGPGGPAACPHQQGHATHTLHNHWESCPHCPLHVPSRVRLSSPGSVSRTVILGHPSLPPVTAGTNQHCMATAKAPSGGGSAVPEGGLLSALTKTFTRSLPPGHRGSGPWVGDKKVTGVHHLQALTFQEKGTACAWPQADAEGDQTGRERLAVPSAPAWPGSRERSPAHVRPRCPRPVRKTAPGGHARRSPAQTGLSSDGHARTGRGHIHHARNFFAVTSQSLF